MEWFKKIEVRGYTYHSSKVLMIVAFLIICIFALYSLNYTKFSGKTFYYTECHTSGMVNECHNAYYQSNLCRELKAIMKKVIWGIKSSMDKELEKKKESKLINTRELITRINDAETDEEIYDNLEEIESFLYSKGVLKWDTKDVVDRTQVWRMNQRFQG